MHFFPIWHSDASKLPFHLEQIYVKIKIRKVCICVYVYSESLKTKYKKHFFFLVSSYQIIFSTTLAHWCMRIKSRSFPLFLENILMTLFDNMSDCMSQA